VARKVARIPNLRAMFKVAGNRYEWHSPVGMTDEELEICGIMVFTDHQTGTTYSPILL